MFRLPDIGEGLTEAEIIAWLVDPGDHVFTDQPVVEVLTDKSAVELPSPFEGMFVAPDHGPGDVVQVGDALFAIDSAAPSASSTLPHTPEPNPQPAPPSTAPSPPTPDSPRAKAAPATRRLARERGIDLQSVVGSGPGGRIVPSDLDAPPTERVADASPAQEPTAAMALRGVRRTIAQTMTRAWSEIPHIHLFDDVDATNLVELRRQLRTAHPERAEHLTATAFFVAAAAHALRRHPAMNASIDMANETIVHHDNVNVGVATATDHGVVVPVIKDTDQLRLIEIAEAIAASSASARDSSLAPDDLRAGTFTVTNFGSFGGYRATPIIRPPECGILGVGRLADQPVARDGVVVIRPMIPLVLGADHRLIDGDVAVSFLESIAAALRDPIALLAGV